MFTTWCTILFTCHELTHSHCFHHLRKVRGSETPNNDVLLSSVALKQFDLGREHIQQVLVSILHRMFGTIHTCIRWLFLTMCANTEITNTAPGGMVLLSHCPMTVVISMFPVETSASHSHDICANVLTCMQGSWRPSPHFHQSNCNYLCCCGYPLRSRYACTMYVHIVLSVLHVHCVCVSVL